MTPLPHRYVVLADRVRGFSTLEEAKRFALGNLPAVICEWQTVDGAPKLVEILRHDWNYDEARGEWRVMLA